MEYGLSPPTRGSPPCPEATGRCGRSIPAHAGEPDRSSRPGGVGAVYPRPRGGAPSTWGPQDPFQGLSPPTRGSRAQRPGRTSIFRSIPAHAGEPDQRQTQSSPSGVYPRPRGGAAAMVKAGRGLVGLSPPTRGSLLSRLGGEEVERSIPAHAGEPGRQTSRATARRVYPRPRGGATMERRPLSATAGLSPPTRGSQGS